MRSVISLAALTGLASAATLASVGADVRLSADVEIDAGAAAKAYGHANANAYADANLGADVDLAGPRARYAGYACPRSMSYCPWTKACACPPGQKFDAAAGACGGAALSGAWPEPDVSVYGVVDVEMGTFCAASPTRIVKYDPRHAYCRASLGTVAFCAPASIAGELKAEADIDIHGSISAELKHVCGALYGLYVETAVDAVIAFNTDTFGLAAVEADVEAGLSSGTLGSLKGFGCRFGFGTCRFDCVGYCTKGCKNYIDVGAEIGGSISGLVGFCIVSKVVLVVDASKHIVAHVTDGLLCLVGGLIKTLLSTFDCHCH